MGRRGLPDLVTRVRYMIDKTSLGEAEAAIITLSQKSVVAHAGHAAAVDKVGNAYTRFGGLAKKHLEEVAKETRGTGLALEALSTAAGGMGGPAGLAIAAAAGLGAGIFTLAKEAENTALSVHQLQLAYGGSAEDASRLRYATEVLGVSQDTLQTSLIRLGRNVETNDKKLEGLGVTVARTKDGHADLHETLLRVADAYAKAGDASTRSQIGFAAFGRGFGEMSKALEGGRANLEALYKAADSHGTIITDADIIKAQELKNTMADISQGWKKFLDDRGKESIGLIGELGKEADAFWKAWNTDAAEGGLGTYMDHYNAADAASKARAKAAIAAEDQRKAVDALHAEIEGENSAALVTIDVTQKAAASQDAYAKAVDRVKAAQTALAAARAAAAGTGPTDPVKAMEAQQKAFDKRTDSEIKAEQAAKSRYDKEADERIRLLDIGTKEEEQAVKALELADQQQTTQEQLAVTQADYNLKIAEGDLVGAAKVHTQLEQEKRKQVLETAKATLQQHQDAKVDAIQKIRDEKQARDDAFDAGIAQVQETKRVQDEVYSEAIRLAQEHKAAVDQVTAAVDTLKSSIDAVDSAALQLAKDTAAALKDAAGGAQDAVQRNQAIYDRLTETAKTAPGPALAQINTWRDALAQLPGIVRTELQIVTSPGAKDALDVIMKLASANGVVPKRAPGATPLPLAEGGQALAGTVHLVGERGPELFIPNVSGQVIPNHRLGGAAGTIEKTVNVTINALNDMGVIRDIVRHELVAAGHDA